MNTSYRQLNKSRIILLVVALFILLIPSVIFAQNFENNVKATISSPTAIDAGIPFRLVITLDHAAGWHTYYKEPGDAGLATSLTWTLPDTFTASEINWPTPTKFSEENLTTYGYTDITHLPVTITPPATLTQQSYDFTVKAEWLTCNKICIPESQILSITVPVNTSPTKSKTEATTAPTQKKTLSTSELSLAAILLSAILGGLILNVMPCVLPVLSLKTLALVTKSGQTRSKIIPHGIAYTLGILLSFAIIAGLLISLQKSGEAIGWGFQMQSPAFVGFLIYLLFLVALNLSGFFHLPVLLGNVGSGIANEHSLRGSFFTGILATMVATPCTAPFMASAVGAALTLPAWAAMLTFLSLGFGLALPFLLISIFPDLLRFLPKAGAWMEQFKEFLAFPMYAAVIWLIWVLGMQVGISQVTIILFGLLLISFIIWLLRSIKNCRTIHRSFTLLALVAMLAASLYSLNAQNTPHTNAETPYSATTLSALRAEGKAIYVDATAAWCITCQVNKRVALNTPIVQEAFRKNNITLMVADWTNKNPEITQFLKSFGYNGVPLNVYYPANGEAIVLPQILTPNIILETIAH